MTPFLFMQTAKLIEPESSTARISDIQQAPIVIVGAGPVGIHVAQTLLELGCDRRIVLCGKEPWDPYDRVKLSNVLAGSAALDDIAIPVSSPSQLEFRKNCEVIAIDRAEKTVLLRDGSQQPYSTLVLATGSQAKMPSVSGLDKEGIFTFRDLNDAQKLIARRARSRVAIVLGGGLLGIETARALRRDNTRIYLIEHLRRLMPQQLDQDASDLLRERLIEKNINVLLGNGVKSILGDERFAGVELLNGRQIEGDTLVVCTGIQPQVSLALDAQISIGRGILVDDSMQTSDKDIYAVGECIEHRNQLYGLVAPGLEQASVAAHNIVGDSARYEGSISNVYLKVVEQKVFASGAVGEEEYKLNLNEVSFRHPDGLRYRKLVLRRSRLIGAISIGDWNDVQRLQEAIQNKRRLWPWQIMRFKSQGLLWSEEQMADIRSWPKQAVICNCKNISLGTIVNAVDDGCTGLDCVKSDTQACTVCGSCQPLIEKILGQQGEAVKDKTLPWLLGGGILALLFTLLYLFFPAITPGDTVQSFQYTLSQLWTNGTYKQITGFSLLGLTIILFTIALRKRAKKEIFGKYQLWRLIHVVLGIFMLTTLILHTGFSMGEKINFLLLLNFVVVMLMGVIVTFVFSSEKPGNELTVRKLKSHSSRFHLYLTWPLPVLLLFHIISVYYF
jgi:nitrite reductase (NADH) large subunit